MDKDFLLVRKMQNGDEDAMNRFVEKYYDKILNYCHYHCYDRQAAQDLTQDTFVRFFGALAGFQVMGKSVNYLYVIARNLCIDHSKRQRELSAQQEFSADSFTQKEGGIDRAAQISMRDIAMEETERRLDIANALKELPEELREIIILHYFQDYTLRRSAELLGIGLPLAKYRIRRAKEELARLLGEEEKIENRESTKPI